MRLKHFSFLFFFLTFNCFSQSTEALKTSAQKLYEANFLMDFEGIAQLSYPKMVENMGKTVFLEKTELHYENEEYRLRYQLQTVPLQFGPVKQVGGKSFCVITIRIPKRYFFENKLTSEQAAEKKAWLQEINNTKDVTFEPTRNSFNVKKISTYVAISDETTNGEWKFFNFDNPEQLATFNSLFDEKTKTALGLNK
ncbi:hypothetical protein [Flavobacterium terrisoli]|uniref:hypothetical protein n=1 Tax=Flavobacterium terrisoli TaxID=3242195 RepID=UPI0025427BEE|nr:hypothetical protein [Flavobacterium buctense]